MQQPYNPFLKRADTYCDNKTSVSVSTPDIGLIMKILARGNDVWIKNTKMGIVVLEADFTKRQEIQRIVK
jgi:hypothetical protein